jgi:hypothetical protein
MYMKLELRRSYYAGGTNSILLADDRVLCFAIERAWAGNLRLVSCIPEGRYIIKSRYTSDLGEHLEVMDVPGRDSILIHPANDALTELKGCIAPVMKLQAPGRGLHSQEALNVVLKQVRVPLSEGQTVYLEIIRKPAGIPAVA